MTGFREIEDADIDSVVALWRLCGLTRDWNDPYKDISFARANTNATVLVGEADGRIIASVMVGHDGHRGAYYYVSVHPEVQGQGTGKALIAAAESWLKDRGVWKVNLLVRDGNDAARAFYEAIGYSVNAVVSMARKITP